MPLRRLLFDIEADGFLTTVTKVHCIAAVDVDTDEQFVWRGFPLEALDCLNNADVLIGHNILRYDLPVLQKIFGYTWDHQEILDTLVLARLIHPNVRDTDYELQRSGRLPVKGHEGNNLLGSHSLEAWGYRIGEHKAQFDGPWDQWSQEMQDYCVQDVQTNVKLWRFLRPDMYSSDAIALEHRIARLCDLIEREGVPFDRVAAGQLHAALTGKKADIEKELVAKFGSWLAPISPTASRSTCTPKRDNATKGVVAGAPYTRLKRVEFNPGSRTHIEMVLKRRGWKPTEFTDGGRAKIDESTLGPIVGKFPEVASIAEYLLLDKRLGQLAGGKQSWLNHVDAAGLIHGVVNPMGTTTSRASHFNPNLGQVPAIRSPYGKECRGLFYAPEGWSLVGADMGGLELRGLAHYLFPMDGGKYGDVVVHSDPHWLHVVLAGLVPEGTEYTKENKVHRILRDGVKTYMYAIIYGAGNEHAGHILLDVIAAANAAGAKIKTPSGNPAYLGAKVRRRLMEKIKGFGTLREKIEMQVERHGWVRGLDGRKIPTRSAHSALNFLIQSAGAILCKRWGCDAVDEMENKWKLGWDGDVVPVLWVHDEYQVACKKGLEEEIGEILTRTARAAGEAYGFRVPLTSEYSVGRTWADTH